LVGFARVALAAADDAPVVNAANDVATRTVVVNTPASRLR
jgi:hypothetical protein